MPRICVFCGGAGPLSREHVVPQWISRLLADDVEIIHFIGEKRLVASTFTHTVSMVCQSCNNGWMSRLEEVVKPILTQAIFEPRSVALLSPITQVNIATWIYKTALMWDRCAATHQSVMPQADYRRIAAKGQPPRLSRVHVALANFLAPDAPRTAAAYHGHTARWPIQEDPSSSATGYVATFHIGYFAALLTNVVDCTDTNPPLVTESPFGSGFARVWPPSRNFRWPPQPPVSLQMLDELPAKL
jgi:hypothetical protein